MNLPKTPDAVTTGLLARSLLFLTHATQHARLNSPLDRMVAIHSLDNSVEHLLRIVVHHLDIEGTTGKSLDSVELASLAGEVNRFLKDAHNVELPYLSEIKLLRQVRNLVQHGAVDPQPDLPRYRTIVERFFDRVLELVFGTGRGSLKMSTLVENDQVRTFLDRSEELIQERKYLESIVASRDAFENARHLKTKNSSLRTSLLPALLESKFDRLNLHYFLREIGEELEAIGLGVEPRNYARFQNYLRHIPRDHCADKSYGRAIMQREWDEQDAKFCYDFTASVVFQWQSEEVERLYPLDMPDKHEWEITIGGVTIPRKAEIGCYYLRDDRDEMETFFVSSDVKDQLMALPAELSTTKKGNVYVNDLLDRKYSFSAILIGSYARVATNNPERWEVILWLRPTSDIQSEVFERNGKSTEQIDNEAALTEPAPQTTWSPAAAK